MGSLDYPLTIADVVDAAAEKYGRRVAVVDGEVRLSFDEVRRLSVRLAKHFLRLGIGRGDCVAVQLPNSWYYVVTHLALTYIGAVLTPLNMVYRRKELQYMLSHNEVKMGVVAREYLGFDHLGLLTELCQEIPSMQYVVASGTGPLPAGVTVLASLLDRDPEDVPDEELFRRRPGLDDPFAILFTSGTESDPKATLHTYRTFVPGHISQAAEYKFSEHDVLLCLGSFSHMFSLPMIFSALHNGLRHVTLEKYSPESFLNLALREGVSVALGVPAMWLDILRVSEQRGEVPKLRLVVTGGSKIPPHMVHQLREKFGCVVAAQWGMTEVCAAAYTRPQDPPEKSWETIGRACPGGEFRILDEYRNVVPNGVVGELAFRGPSVFVEYHKNPRATEVSLTDDGFFLTGDLAWMDEQGYLHFVGRTKDTINRGGLKIYAVEIEDLMLEHPAIRQVAVVKMPDARLGERACAFVSLAEGYSSLTLEEVKDFLLGKGVAVYKLPERLEIRDELPITASGKVQKARLVAEAQAFAT